MNCIFIHKRNLRKIHSEKHQEVNFLTNSTKSSFDKEGIFIISKFSETCSADF